MGSDSCLCEAQNGGIQNTKLIKLILRHERVELMQMVLEKRSSSQKINDLDQGFSNLVMPQTPKYDAPLLVMDLLPK